MLVTFDLATFTDFAKSPHQKPRQSFPLYGTLCTSSFYRVAQFEQLLRYTRTGTMHDYRGCGHNRGGGARRTKCTNSMKLYG